MIPQSVLQIVLSLIQGFAEVFPVSSSGHMVVYAKLLGVHLDFDHIIFLHLGTLLAISVFYRREVIALITGKMGWRVPLFFLASFVATGLVGLVVEALLAERVVANPQLVSLMWLITALVLGWAGLFGPLGSRAISDLTLREFLTIGIIQGFAAPPGISRLGLTLAAAVYHKLEWPEAVKLSFLLALPTIIGANLVEGLKLLRISFLHGGSDAILLTGLTGPLDLSASGFSLAQNSPFFLIAFLSGLVGLYLLYRIVFLGRRLLLDNPAPDCLKRCRLGIDPRSDSSS